LDEPYTPVMPEDTLRIVPSFEDPAAAAYAQPPLEYGPGMQDADYMPDGPFDTTKVAPAESLLSKDELALTDYATMDVNAKLGTLNRLNSDISRLAASNLAEDRSRADNLRREYLNLRDSFLTELSDPSLDGAYETALAEAAAKGIDTRSLENAKGSLDRALAAKSPGEAFLAKQNVTAAIGTLDRDRGRYVTFSGGATSAVGTLQAQYDALSPVAKSKVAGAYGQLTTQMSAMSNTDLSIADRIDAAKMVQQQAASLSTTIAANNTARIANGLSLKMVNGWGETTGDINYSALPVYLTMFGAVFAPLMQYKQAKDAREFQLDFYERQRQDNREDARYGYELKKEFGYDPASVAAAEHSYKGSAPTSKAPSLSSAKVKVS